MTQAWLTGLAAKAASSKWPPRSAGPFRRSRRLATVRAVWLSSGAWSQTRATSSKPSRATFHGAWSWAGGGLVGKSGQPAGQGLPVLGIVEVHGPPRWEKTTAARWLRDTARRASAENVAVHHRMRTCRSCTKPSGASSRRWYPARRCPGRGLIVRGGKAGRRQSPARIRCGSRAGKLAEAASRH